MLDAETIEESQARLLHRIAEQDQQALAALYDQLAGVLFSTTVRILSDPAEAEEVIQDVFVQIWQKASLFDRALGTPLHWTLSITRNRAIDRLRSRQRRSRVTEALENTAVIETALASPNPALMSEDELLAIRAAVKELGADERQAIELAFFTGLSHGEIAEQLEQPLGTIKARIRRGMLKLRDRLEARL